MAQSNRDIGLDRRRVAAGQAYEVGYFACKNGLTRDEARDIIRQAGNSRDKANAGAVAQPASADTVVVGFAVTRGEANTQPRHGW